MPLSRATGFHHRNRHAPRPPSPSPLSEWSTPAVPDSAWWSGNFMLGAGMLIIERNTHKVVLVYEKVKNYYFLPKGRKDVGESLEQAALREAYEESGYRASFMAHFAPCHAPIPPLERDRPYHSHNEAIYITTMNWAPRRTRNGSIEAGGEYITHWYLGEIPDDAIREQGTGMPDEVNYEARLIPFEEARRYLGGTQRAILEVGWLVYSNKLKTEDHIATTLQEEFEAQARITAEKETEG